MKDNDIKNKISSAFCEETPDILERILESCEREEQMSAPVILEQSSGTVKKKTGGFIRVASKIAFAASFLIVFTLGIVLGGLLPAVTPSGELANVYIDVNPSIELKVNESGIVADATAANSDAELIMTDMNLKGVEIKTALNALIGSMYMKGYLSAESNSILVTTNSESEKFDSLLEQLANDVNDIFKAAEIECSMIAQDIDYDEAMEKLALDNNVSLGKISLVNKIISKIDDYTEDNISELASMSISELDLIYSTVKNKQLEDAEGDGKDDEPFDGENVKEIILGNNKAFIDSEDAEARVLEAIGIDADNSHYISKIITLPMRDGEGYRMVYKVYVYFNFNEYIYAVDCKSAELEKISEREGIFPNINGQENDEKEGHEKEEDDRHRR